MNTFDKESKSQLLQAIYQNQTYILITPDQPAKVSICGSIKDVENKLREAMKTDLVFKRIVENITKPKPAETSVIRRKLG